MPSHRSLAMLSPLVCQVGMLALVFATPVNGLGQALGEAPQSVSRLPSLDIPAERNDPRDVVLHSGGAVGFRSPLGWRVSETAVGREIRLILTPGSPPRRIDHLVDAIWICYHAQRVEDYQATRSRAANPLASFVVTRVQKTAGRDSVLGKPLEKRIAEHLGWAMSFESPAAVQKKLPARRGIHLALATRHGVFEARLIAPVALYNERRRGWDKLLASLTLAAPRELADRPPPHLAAATDLLGSWKSTRGRLRVQSDGRLELRFDRDGVFPVDIAGNVSYEDRVTELAGRYRAEGDLLRVTWDDGSRTNYRWRRERAELFLTDHTGRASQLRLIYE